MTTENESWNALRAGSPATTPSSCATGSSAGSKTTARQTDCDGGAGRNGENGMKYRIDGAVRHGSRVDGGMVVATLAFAAVVFAIGVIVGILL